MTMKKACGFYTGILAAIVCVVTAVLYSMKFSVMTYKEPVYDTNICIVLAVTAVVSIVMLLVQKLANFAPVVLCAGSGIATLFYIKVIIWPVSDTIYGIEPFPYISDVILCAILMVVGFVLSEICLYMPKLKEAN